MARIAKQLCHDCGADAGLPHTDTCPQNRQDFRSLVADMRRAQKQYFMTRASHDLDRAKLLEKKVDRALKDQGQTTLF